MRTGLIPAIFCRKLISRNKDPKSFFFPFQSSDLTFTSSSLPLTRDSSPALHPNYFYIAFTTNTSALFFFSSPLSTRRNNNDLSFSILNANWPKGTALMGSLAKPSQYWIKKQSEGSQSGSKNIVSFNFAFSLRVSLSIFTITLRFFFSLPTPGYSSSQASFFWLLLKPARFNCDKEQAITTYFSPVQVLLFRLLLFGFSWCVSLPVFTSRRFVLALLANGRKEREKGGKRQRFLFFFASTWPQNHGFKTRFCVSATPKTAEWCRMVCFVRRVDGKACP